VVNLSELNDPVTFVENITNQQGADAVIIAATTTSSEPVSQAAKMCRKRGRIVLSGVVGLQLCREDFFKKEISFQVSCSYGPGRYDNHYELDGHDYPIGFVRWTEQRNFEAIIQAIKENKLVVQALISHRYPVNQLDIAYQTLLQDTGSLGIILNFPRDTLTQYEELEKLKTMDIKIPVSPRKSELKISVIGSGNYASRVLIPAFHRQKIKFETLFAKTGSNSVAIGKKYNFQSISTDMTQLSENKEDDLVIVATRHDSHGDYVCKLLNSNKHIFVEKPLALTLDEIDEIKKLYYNNLEKNKLIVGFNRRFSPYIQKMKYLLKTLSQPKAIHMTINAGHISMSHWTQDRRAGGGRIIGEACHFVDLARFLAGSQIIESNIKYMNDNQKCFDTAIISLKFSDGSIASINYFSNGNKSVSKERIEVFCEGKYLFLNNFKKLIGYGWKNFKKMKSLKQNKGQNECVHQFIESIKNSSESPIPFDEIIEVSRVCVDLANAN
jgi:predicted dehydrogenase